MIKDEKNKTHFPKLSKTGSSFRDSEDNPFYVPDDSEVHYYSIRFLGLMTSRNKKRKKREGTTNP